MKRLFAIFYEGKLLVCVEAQPALDVALVLDNYARNYAFNRNKLTGTVIDCLSLAEVMKST